MPSWNPRTWFTRSGLTEAANNAPAEAAPATVNRSGFEYAVPPGGLHEYNQAVGAATQSDRRSLLTQLYESYLACPWSWACVNAIARTITAGGLVFDFDTDTGEGDQQAPEKPPEVLACERLFRYCNPREDIRQLMRGVIADLLVFGDAFIEVVWLAGIPVALYSLDAPSMLILADEHGEITKYVQLTEYHQRAEFDPHEVIHISLDSPRSGLFGVSPTQAALLPITAWLFTAATLKETFRKGNPSPIWVDHPQGMAQPEQNRWVQQYMTRNIGPRNIGNPVITKGGATVHELAKSRIDELLHTLDQKRDEILASYGVPPAQATIIESGNIGGGTGEAQAKQFRVNTCSPIATLVLEKIDFSIVRQGFGIDGWHVKFTEVDMRDSEVIERIRDMRIRNGLWTLNKARTEAGEPPVDGGDQAVLIDRQNLVLWRDIGAMSTASIAMKLKGTNVEPSEDSVDNPDNPVTLTKTEPPEPPPQQFPPMMVPQNLDDLAQDGDVPAGGESYRYAGRPLRETYQARLRQALRELPPVDDLTGS